jgi:mannitol-1-phosphate 5-dehydrogenase
MSHQFSKLAVQFGAGNIGRGFIGVLLAQAGYEVVFVDVIEALVEAINGRGRYTIKELNGDQTREITVENVHAINGRAEAEVAEVISRASLVTTAVGPNVLPIIAPGLAKGLQRRAELALEQPLNVIACENLLDNSRVLRDHVLTHLSPARQSYVATWVGFPNCVVDKIVTTLSEAERQQDPLPVRVDAYGQLVVDQNAFAGPLPAIPGLQFTPQLPAYVEQKIFTLNTAHAVIAYLGYGQGYEFIHEALADPDINRIVTGLLAECSAMLVKRHGLSPADQEYYVANTLRRFANPALPDPVGRVGRDPKRKLAPNDRLVRPALLALEAGLTPTYLATGIAAALLYDNPADTQAVAISQAVQEQGVDAVLAELCHLTAEHPLSQLVKDKLVEVRAWLGR